jgi:hypothetical protein
MRAKKFLERSLWEVRKMNSQSTSIVINKNRSVGRVRGFLRGGSGAIGEEGMVKRKSRTAGGVSGESRVGLYFKLAVFVFFLLVLSGSVLALGVTPGRKIFEYSSGGSTGASFTVLNTENKDMDLVVLIQGDMNSSIEVSEVQFRMTSGENEKQLNYKVNMPSGLRPGLHKSEIVVIQLPGRSAEGDTFVGATVGVATQIHVNVPFPGKYAEADLNVVGPNNDGVVSFVMPVESKGDLDLARVRATVDIFSSLNEKITSVNSDEISLLSGKRAEIVATWDAVEAQPGPYRAVATLIYDEQTLTLEREFNVGKRLLEVAGIEINDFSLGEIAKFEILVENKWNQVINGVFAQMNVFNDAGEVMADFKSQTYDIPSLEKVLMIAFWDTEGVGKGTYDSSMFLRYGDSSEQEDFKLEVDENSINVVGVGYVISKGGSSGDGMDSLTIVLIIVIAVMIMINVIWFLVLRKKLGNKKK